jgi:hypothetical protein
MCNKCFFLTEFSSAEQKTLGILFVSNHSAEEKKLEIPYRGTKIEANSQNSIPNHSTEEKTTRIPFSGTKIETSFWNFVPNHFTEENTLSILFDRTENFSFQSLFQNVVTENFQI